MLEYGKKPYTRTCNRVEVEAGSEALNFSKPIKVKLDGVMRHAMLSHPFEEKERNII